MRFTPQLYDAALRMTHDGANAEDPGAGDVAVVSTAAPRGSKRRAGPAHLAVSHHDRPGASTHTRTPSATSSAGAPTSTTSRTCTVY